MLPLKFLDAYKKEDFGFYFGRETETDTLYEKVKRNTITLFYGLSGTGKTSLILCGLSNKFDDADWMAFVIRRGNKSNIIDVIKKTLYSKTDEIFNDESVDLSIILDKIYYNHYRPIYLIFDQLEELFIYGTKTEKFEFISFIIEVQKNNHYVKVILVLREEYFVHIDDFESKIPAIFQSRLRLEPMKTEKVIDTIKKMGLAIKVNISDALAEEIINHITSKNKNDICSDNAGSILKKEIELPYLQVYFKEMFEKKLQIKLSDCPADKLIDLTKEDLPELGAINDVLTDFLDNAVKNINQHIKNEDKQLDEQLVWQVLNTLVSYEGTKQEKSLEEIITLLS